MEKRKNKSYILVIFVMLIILTLITLSLLFRKMGSYVVENGELSLDAVDEQIQQTFDLQLDSCYKQLQFISDYLYEDEQIDLSVESTKEFFDIWQEEFDAELLFMKENGSITRTDGTNSKLDISSSLLMELKEGKNIAKIISTKYKQESGSGFLMAIPCEEYIVNGEAYNALGAVLDREKLDSLLKISGYGGKANIFMIDKEGYVVYSNKGDDKYFQNYNLLKHLVAETEMIETQAKNLKKSFENRETGADFFKKGKAYYLGYRPINNNDAMIVTIIPKSIVDNSLISYQNTVFLISIGMGLVIVLLFMGLTYSTSKVKIANEEMKFKELELRNLKELEEVNKNLELAQKATVEALMSAENANKAKTDFLASMSHDIRTPMNAIVGMTSLIERDCDNSDKVKEYAKKIDISSHQLLGIINDVLDMNKIESGKMVLRNNDFSILELIKEVETGFNFRTQEKNQSFEVIKKNIKHEWANADKIRIVQILNNLLSNAVKYTQVGGDIKFLIQECNTASKTYAKYKFVVEDNGMGMDPSFKDKIFDAFTREETSFTNKIQGTGLGMAITKNLLEAMGGAIKVESEKGKGSKFEVPLDLKIVNKDIVEKEEIEESYDDILKGMNFLCAEDNEINAEILEELLKMEGATCTICDDGEKIVEAFKKSNDYDAILMDVQMPVMNGYEATKLIREIDKKITIIAMTANAFSEDIQHSLEAGMNAHVSKPVDMKVLKKTIFDLKNK